MPKLAKAEAAAAAEAASAVDFHRMGIKLSPDSEDATLGASRLDSEAPEKLIQRVQFILLTGDASLLRRYGGKKIPAVVAM